MCYGKLNKHKHSNKGGFIIKHYIKNNLPLVPLCKSLHNGNIWMKWDNGRTLPVVPEEDSFRKLTDEALAQEQATNRKVVEFGDDCEISIPTEPIDCSKMGYFDELEYDCWDLVKKYCEKFGIEIKSGDISFDIAKGIQDHIIDQFQNAGVEFNFNNEITEGEAPVLGM